MNINAMNMTHDELFPYMVKCVDAGGKITIINFIDLQDAIAACNTPVDDPEELGLKENGSTLEIFKRDYGNLILID